MLKASLFDTRKKHDIFLHTAIMQIRPMAAMYINFPAGSAASERGFSITSAIVTKQRNRISDDTLEQLTVIRDYLTQTDYTFEDLVSALAELQSNISE